MKSLQHYIAGRWSAPVKPGNIYPVVNPANEEQVAEIRMGSEADVELAVEAEMVQEQLDVIREIDARVTAFRFIRNAMATHVQQENMGVSGQQPA